MTDVGDDPTALAADLRALLSRRTPVDPFLTYQAVATALCLTPPGTIQRLVAMLEQTMREDVAAGRPMIAALVISRAGDMPRRGFFDLAVALGRFPEDPGQHCAEWEAECAAVFRTQSGAST
ncbi:MAG: hypothetical protein ACK4WC_14295 [Rubrimonas sp.]